MQSSIATNPNPPANANPEGGIDLGSILSTLKRHIGLIAAITTACAGVAGARAYFSPPTYTARFDILIQPLSAETEVIQTSITDTTPNQKQTSLSLEDQARILTGPGVLQPVVVKSMEEEIANCTLASSNTGVSEEEHQRRCYSSIRERLNLRTTEDSRIVGATLEGASREETRYLAELISKTFLDYGLASRQRDIRQGLDFLNEKVPDVRQRVESLEADLEALRQNNNLITPEARGGQLNEQINNFDSQYLALLVELDQKVSLYDDLRQELAQRPQDTSVSPALSESGRYQALISNLLDLDSQIAEASTLFLDASPDMQVLIEERNNLLNLLAREGANVQRELLTEIELLNTQRAALEATLDSLNVDVDTLASVSRQFTDLERDLAIAINNLNQLLERRETLQIEAAQRELPWELVTPPTLSASTESLTNSLVLGGILGVLLGTGLAFLLDAQKGVLYSPKDIKRITPVPILGLIPYNQAVGRGDDEEYLLTLFPPVIPSSASGLNQPKSVSKGASNGSLPNDDIFDLREAFRSLAINIQQASEEGSFYSLALSSVDEELADSTTATYLAWMAAEMGHRVLLIDADLEGAYLHKSLGLPNKRGFSNLLAQDLSLKEVYHRSPMEHNLFFMTTGQTARDPAKLLLSHNIRKLIKQAQAEFDLVIFNCPPFTQYADAGLIAAETNGLALLSHLGAVKSYQLEETLEKVWISNLPLIGFIAKEMPPKLPLLPKQRLFEFSKVS